MSHDYSGAILGATPSPQLSNGNSLMTVVQPLDNSTPSYHNINSMMNHSNHSNMDTPGGGSGVVMNQTFTTNHHHHHHMINQSSQVYGISSVSDSNQQQQYSVVNNGNNTRSGTIPTLINGGSLKNNNSSNNSSALPSNHQPVNNVYHCLNPSISGISGSTTNSSQIVSSPQQAAPISSPHHFAHVDQQSLNTSDPMNSVINRSLSSSSSYPTQTNSMINSTPATNNIAAIEQGFSKNEAPNPSKNYNQSSWPTMQPFYNSSVVQSHIGSSTNSGNNSVNTNSLHNNNLLPNTNNSSNGTNYSNLYHHQIHPAAAIKSSVTSNENSLIASDHHYSNTGLTSHHLNQNNAMTSAANCTSNNNGSVISSSYSIPINQSCSPNQTNPEYNQQSITSPTNNYHIPNPKVDSNDPSNISLHSSPTFSYNTFNTTNSLTQSSNKDSPSTSTVDLNDEKTNPEKENPFQWKISEFKRSVFYELIHDYEMKRARIYLLQHFPYYDHELMTSNLFDVTEDEEMKMKNNDLKEVLVHFDEIQFLLYLFVGRRVDAYGVLASMINNGLILNDNKYSTMLFDYSLVESFSPEESITVLKNKIEIFLNKYGIEEETDYSPLGIKMQSLEQKLELEQQSDEDSESDFIFVLSEEEDEYEPHLKYYNNCYQNYIPEVYYRPTTESPNSNSNSNDNPYDLSGSLSNTDSSSFSPSLVKKSKKKQSSRDSDRSSSDSQEDDDYMPPAGGGISKKGKLKKKRRSNAKRACHHCRRSHLRCTNVRPCCRCLARGLDCFDIE